MSTQHTHTYTENTPTYTLSLSFTLSSAFRQGHSALFPQNTPSVKYHCWKRSGWWDSLRVCVCVCVIQMCRLGWNSERPLVQEQSLRIYGYVPWLHIELQACVMSQVAQLQWPLWAPVESTVRAEDGAPNYPPDDATPSCEQASAVTPKQEQRGPEPRCRPLHPVNWGESNKTF